MARLFDDGSNQYLEISSAVVTAAPFTLACWFNTDDNGNDQCLISIGSPTTNRFYLNAQGSAGGDPIRFQARQALSQSCETTSGYSTNTWHHACGVAVASDERNVYIDGGSKGTNVVAQTPAGLSVTAIGRLSDASATNYMSGSIAHAAIWNAALTDEEVVALAAGAHPFTIRPQSLVAYYPLVRTDQDIVGGYDMTPQNGPTFADQPGKVYGIALVQVGKTAAGASTESESASPSLSESASESASPSFSESASPSPGPEGDVCWGHVTDVLETNVLTFDGNWTGTGEIENPGANDNERLVLNAGEVMTSEMVNTGAVDCVILQNEYAVGDDVTLEFREGTTAAECNAAAWGEYVAQFTSEGFVQVRVTSTL